MAAQAWKLYNEAKKKIGNTTLNLASTSYRITLHTSASNFATATLSIYSELTNEVSEATGYSSSGKALTSERWTVGASAGQYMFDVGDPVWTATGGNIANIKGAVIWNSSTGTFLLVRASLTSSQFTLSSGNTLTLQMNSSGVFTMA
jgi:hypothetical protein